MALRELQCRIHREVQDTLGIYRQYRTMVTQITHRYIEPEEPTCTNFVPSPVLTHTKFERL